MTQWLVEEAAFAALELAEQRADRAAQEEAEASARMEELARRALSGVR